VGISYFGRCVVVVDIDDDVDVVVVDDDDDVWSGVVWYFVLDGIIGVLPVSLDGFGL